MKVVSIVNQKGGVGKTTTAVNVATGLATVNQKVLLIDLDSQGNASTAFNINQSQRKITIYQALVGASSIESAIIKNALPNLDLISANTHLAAVDVEIGQLKKKEFVLSRLLESLLNHYDYIIIDCPPSLGVLTINALVSSDEIFIPMQCEFYSLEGLSHLLKTIDIVKKHLNPKISIGGIIFTMYDKRTKLTEEVERDVRKNLGSLVFQTTIPRNVKLSEAPSYGKPAIIYDYKCSGSIAYMNLIKEILNKDKVK